MLVNVLIVLYYIVYLASINQKAKLMANVVYMSPATQSPYSEPLPLTFTHQTNIYPVLNQHRARYQTTRNSPKYSASQSKAIYPALPCLSHLIKALT
mgnify:CR=1 FL=1